MTDPLARPIADPVLSQCDREPIHVPGAVQPHGALLAFEPRDGRITHWSENLAEVVALASEPDGGSVRDVLGADVLERIESMRHVDAPGDGLPLPAVVAWDDRTDVAMHRSDDLTVLEFEAQSGASEDRDPLVHEVRHAVWRLESALDVTSVCAIAAEELRRLSGYDRVMVYRFHEDEHGEVVAEARDPQLESYLGLHYPATDIPHPARRLLRLSPTRVIADVDAPPVPIAASDTRGGRPIDLSRSALRAVSPIHLQYLRNMGVAASLTISLSDGPRLWGLLACHHGTPRRPRAALRAACEVLARTTWLRIEALESLERHIVEHDLQALATHFIASLSASRPLAEALTEEQTLLELVGADGVTVRVEDVSVGIGTTPPRAAIAALLERLRELSPGRPFVTDALGELVPGLRDDAATAAGMLAVPITDLWGEHVLWFRGERTRDLTWAGNPDKPTEELAGATLGPRRSFVAWNQTLRGHSLPWSGPQIAAAVELIAALPDVRRARTRDALAELALRDSLTGLPNRALLLDRLEVALNDLRRTGRKLSLLFLDLDSFKQVNDNLGHEAGDRLLVEVARRLREAVRALDTVARLGGDEFVILCPSDPDSTDQDGSIEELADRVLASLAEPVEVDGQMCSVTTSIGMATLGEHDSPADALRAADAAMYRAKHAGSNRASR